LDFFKSEISAFAGPDFHHCRGLAQFREGEADGVWGSFGEIRFGVHTLHSHIGSARLEGFIFGEIDAFSTGHGSHKLELAFGF
jgi:hypothetical protein